MVGPWVLGSEVSHHLSDMWVDMIVGLLLDRNTSVTVFLKGMGSGVYYKLLNPHRPDPPSAQQWPGRTAGESHAAAHLGGGGGCLGGSLRLHGHGRVFLVERQIAPSCQRLERLGCMAQGVATRSD